MSYIPNTDADRAEMLSVIGAGLDSPLGAGRLDG